MPDLPFPRRRSVAVLSACRPISMGQDDDFDLMVGALDYVLNNSIVGAFVECGVYKGAYPLAACMTMKDRSDWRDVWLYDTFAGMPQPDVERDTNEAQNHVGTLAVPRDEVRHNLGEFANHCKFVAGDVRETLPTQAPESIAILRLDVDWYAATKHCLETLYPRLSSGGVLILDDYNYWQGAKLAMDEYLLDAPLVRAGTGSAMVKA